MNKVRITAIRQTVYPDLMAKQKYTIHMLYFTVYSPCAKWS